MRAVSFYFSNLLGDRIRIEADPPPEPDLTVTAVDGSKVTYTETVNDTGWADLGHMALEMTDGGWFLSEYLHRR